MPDDRVGRSLAALRGAALAALARVGERGLECAFALGESLQPDPEPRVIHHREHVLEAAIDLADQPAPRIVEVHHAGGRAVDAELVLDARAADAIRRAGLALGVRQELRHQEHADAARARGRVRELGENQVDDVLGQVVLAARDEDLGAGDAVRVRAVRFGACAHEAEIGARMRFGQHHRAAPHAAHELRQVDAAHLLGAALVEAEDGAVGEPAVELPGHVGGDEHLADDAPDALRQALPARLGGPAERGPAVVHVLAVSGGEAGRRDDAPVFQAAHADAVAGLVGRGDHVLGKARRPFEDALDQLGVDVVAPERAVVGRGAQHLVQDVAEFAKGRLVGRHAAAAP